MKIAVVAPLRTSRDSISCFIGQPFSELPKFNEADLDPRTVTMMNCDHKLFEYSDEDVSETENNDVVDVVLRNSLSENPKVSLKGKTAVRKGDSEAESAVKPAWTGIISKPCPVVVSKPTVQKGTN